MKNMPLKAVVFTVINKIACLIPFIAIVFFMKEILKAIETGKSLSIERSLTLWAIGIIGFFVILIAVKLAFRKNFIPAYKQIEKIRISLADHIQDLPMKLFNNTDTSGLSDTISSDCVTLETVLCELYPNLYGNIIFTALSIVILAFVDRRLALVMVLTIPLALLVEFLSLRLQRRLSLIQIKSRQNMSKVTREYIDGIRVVKAHNLGGDHNQRIKQALDEMKRASMKLELTAGIFITGSEIILNLGIGLVIWFCVYNLSDGGTSLLSVLVYFMAVLCIYDPVVEIIELTSGLTYMKASVDRIKNLLSLEKMEEGEDVEFEDYGITVENVTFSYESGNKPDVLKNISMDIKPGQVVALVGPSGCGKTTLAKLLIRFWDSDEGRILIGGRDIRTINPYVVTKAISTVFQEVVLFNDTIAGNIRIGREDATNDEVVKAAKAACCMEFVDKLEKGIDTVICENGNSLSGGERQRISIARAILKDAPILILDEATASLDPENEESVQRALSGLCKKQKTIIVIAHRLKTIVDADKIFVMDNGRIVEQGNHRELMKANGLYRKMYDIQEKMIG